MLNRLILKVTKFQLPPPERLGTVVKNILGGHHAPSPPCQIGLTQFDYLRSVHNNLYIMSTYEMYFKTYFIHIRKRNALDLSWKDKLRTQITRGPRFHHITKGNNILNLTLES